MSHNPQEPWRPPEPPNRPPRPPMPPRNPLSGGSRSRWTPWIVLGIITVLFMVIFSKGSFSSSTAREKLSFSQLQDRIEAKQIKTVTYNRDTGEMTGKFATPVNDHAEFSAAGPAPTIDDATLKLFRDNKIEVKYTHSDNNPVLGAILQLVVPLLLIGGILYFMSRRAQQGMGAVMNIGRSRAKVYTTEKPKTTFADVAGYDPVKEEIKEVVDFLKQPGKFREIGARG